jgi:PAS domain S-box-containing protein
VISVDELQLLKEKKEKLEEENKKLLVYSKNLEKQVEILSEKYAMANNILFNTHDLVIEVDTNLVVTFVNENAVKSLGYQNQEEILGRVHVRELWAGEGKENQFFEECIKTRHPIKTMKAVIKNRNREEKIFLINAGPILNVMGEIKGAYAIYTDITSLEMTREELRKTNEELQNTNEELEATNEELHQTTEELRTSNEELLASNEELKIVTEELKQMKDELEERVKHRTIELEKSRDELQKKVEELEKFTELAIGRELVMVELKEENTKLSREIIKLKKELAAKK